MSIRSVLVARLCYLLICELAGVLIALSTKGTSYEVSVWAGLGGGLAVAGLFIFMESLMKGFTLRGFSNATFGLLIGLLCAWLLTRVGIDDLIAVSFADAAETVALATRVTIFSTLGFIGAVLALRSAREDFAFIIPYIRFRSDSLGGRPVLLDHSAIVDGRLQGLLKSGFIPSNLLIPDFELEALRTMADDGESASGRAGRFGLQQLEDLQNSKSCELGIHDSRDETTPDEGRLDSLISVARLLGARVLTTSSEFAQLARLKHVAVLNINELVTALTPEISVGQTVTVALVKPGRDPSQAVGFLQDGTMIVVNRAADQIGRSCLVGIIGSSETGSGTLYFAEPVS